MEKSRKWKAEVIPDFAGRHETLEVSGEINTGSNKMKPSLEKRDPQGFNPAELLLEAKPVTQNSSEENFQPVMFKEQAKHIEYTSVRIFIADSDEVLYEGEIERTIVA